MPTVIAPLKTCRAPSHSTPAAPSVVARPTSARKPSCARSKSSCVRIETARASSNCRRAAGSPPNACTTGIAPSVRCTTDHARPSASCCARPRRSIRPANSENAPAMTGTAASAASVSVGDSAHITANIAASEQSAPGGRQQRVAEHGRDAARVLRDAHERVADRPPRVRPQRQALQVIEEVGRQVVADALAQRQVGHRLGRAGEPAGHEQRQRRRHRPRQQPARRVGRRQRGDQAGQPRPHRPAVEDVIDHDLHRPRPQHRQAGLQQRDRRDPRHRRPPPRRVGQQRPQQAGRHAPLARGGGGMFDGEGHRFQAVTSRRCLRVGDAAAQRSA